ncbi:MAG: segregation/condensation protein A [Alphaproteobacteria bacterium]|nr:segregation/condensation protein A [Alphaproteobacteria bacterium]
MSAEIVPFQEDASGPAATPSQDPESLVVDLGAYEGPLDVLLALAREQKVDLTKISILALADQYLAFIERVKRVRLELAADYLVMAAWLAFLKSRLLLPAPPEVAAAEPSAAEMAEALAFQLRRLDAMRAAGERVMALPQFGRQVFGRGEPEGLKIVRKPVYDLSYYELLKAYGQIRGRESTRTLTIEATELYSMDAALERLSSMLGRMPEWTSLLSFVPTGLRGGVVARSATASTLAASLELVRTGRIQIRQERGFGPIYVRKAPENPVTELPVVERQGS